MPRNNRRAGHGYELEIATLLRESGLFPHIVTSRSENRTRDGEKVDLVNKDEGVNGRLCYNIQCKNAVERPNYHQLLSEMPSGEEINVVLHKYTKKSGTRFLPLGRYATMTQDDFIKLAKYRRAYELLLITLDLIEADERAAIIKHLEDLSL